MYQITADQIEFDMCVIVSKYYIWQSHPTIIQDIINKFYTNQTIVFNFRDGENLYLSGALELIKLTQQIFNIPKEKLIILSHNTIDVPYATCKKHSKMFLGAVSKFIQPINNKEFDKKFLCLLGRLDIFRLKMAMYLHAQHKDSTLLSFRPTYDYALWYFSQINNLYIDELEWIKNHSPILIDELTSVQKSGSCKWAESMETVAKYSNRYFLEIVIETDIYNPEWITEKTVRSLALGKPFILFSGTGALEHLHNLEFKTFSPWINEQYDQIVNPFDRLSAIQQEIGRLAAMSIDELNNIADRLQPIVEHNQYMLRSKNWRKFLL
jgi:hypothetical protein